ncbi:MAG TPA: thiamine pyrophosphate-dependent enzyme [Magnetospirillaceae bacterium]|jgi:pyruvate dehydrogenase E1 component alpha subunit
MNFASAEELRDFETEIVRLWEAGDLPYLLHLSGGNEDWLVDFFRQVDDGDWIFSTHRNHFHALLSGVPAAYVKKMICEGNSMFTFDRERHFLTSSILAGTCCIAAGVAWALKEEGSKNKVWCFIGDGGEEEGHFYEAVMMVMGHNLPCTFVIEDNNRSVDTTLEERLPTGFRMSWPSCVVRHSYTPTYPHAGSGCKHIIQFKPLSAK